MRKRFSVRGNGRTAYAGIFLCQMVLIISLSACTSLNFSSETVSTNADINKPSIETTQQHNVKKEVENNLSTGEVITPENVDQIAIVDRINTGVSVCSLAFSPDGYLLATGGEGNVNLWDTASMEAVRTLEVSTNRVYSLAFSPDGRMLAIGGNEDNTIWLWDPNSGEALHSLESPTNNAYDLAFSPDGSVLSAAGYSEHTSGNETFIYDDETVILWKVENWQLLHSFDPGILWVESVDFSPDGRMLATGGCKRIVLWDTVSWERLQTLDAPSHTLAFSPDGRILAAGGSKGTVLWDAVSWEILHRLNDYPYSLSFSPDGRLLFSAAFGQDETLIWGIP